METYSLVIGLIVVALFVIPVWLFQRTQNKATRILKKSFNQHAYANGLSISESDMWNNSYSIGLDSKKNKLLYLRHTDSGDQTMVIDLTTPVKCNIERKTQQVGSGKRSIANIEHLDLVLTHRDTVHTRDVLEFYDESTNLHLNGELLLAEKWQKILEKN